MTETLIAKNKMAFVDGSLPRNQAGSGERQSSWDRCDANVKGWLKTAMTKEVRNSVRTATTARAIWIDLQRRFSKGSAQRAYELRRTISSTRQEKQTVSSFYTHLRSLWDEMQAVEGVAHCSCGGCTCGGCSCDLVQKQREKQDIARLFEFLMGLDDAYSVIQSQILGTKPTPTLADAYQMVAAEEQHRHITNARRPPIETSAFHTQIARDSNEEQDSPRCSHCNRKGHLKETCYKLIGFPPGHPKHKPTEDRSGNSGRRSKVAHVERETIPVPGLTAAQFAQLQQLLSSASDARSEPTAHMAGNYPDLYEWLIDSGCNEHIVRDSRWLTSVDDNIVHSQVRIPDGTGIPVKNMGTVKLSDSLTLQRVLHVPEFKCNLLSVSRLTQEHNVEVIFLNDVCMIQDSHSKTLIGVGKLRDGLYYLQRFGEELGTTRDPLPQACRVDRQAASRELWHVRLGHPSLDKLFLLKDLVGCSFDSRSSFHCDPCVRAKQARNSFLLSSIKTSTCFDLIHLDIWGPYKTPATDGSHYFLTMVDDYSRGTWVYLMKFKSDTERYLRSFFALVRTQYGKKVRRLKADNGPEFQTASLRNYYEEQGIVLQTTCTDTPQQNGVVERKHRHLLDTARSLMFHANLSVRFWGECVLTAAYLINRLPLVPLSQKTPFEILLGRVPAYTHIRSFGCLVYAKDTHYTLDKFAERGRAGVFIGYPGTQKGYRVYDLHTRKIYTSRDVHFVENTFPFRSSTSGSQKDPTHVHGPSPMQALFDLPPAGHVEALNDVPNSDNDPMDEVGWKELPITSPLPSTSSTSMQQGELLDDVDVSTSPSPPHVSTQQEGLDQVNVLPDSHTGGDSPSHQADPPDALRRSHRDKRPPSKLDVYEVTYPKSSHHVQFPISNHVSYHRFSSDHCAFLASITKLDEPRHFSEAVQYEYWRVAMQKEIDALVANGTWTLEPLPPGKRLIDSKWVYKIKYQPDGSIERFKARLVAKGFTQLEGIDFHDTFAPVAKLVTVRVLLAVAAQRNWSLHQLDVNNAFLHGDLDEEVYMRVPQGFARDGDTRVCRLRKSLYGLRQASRNWYAKFASALVDFGFTMSRADNSLFIYHTPEAFVAVLIYVDDVVLTGDAPEVIQSVKTFLHQRFSIKDLGVLKYFLGIEVARSPDGIVLSQRKYTLDILKDSGLGAARPSSFPMEQNHTLTRPTDDRADDVSSYRRLVGRLLYLTITRPDIAYSVNVLSQFVHSPSPDHIAAAHRVLRYLKTAPGQGLFLPSAGSLELIAYCDSDWAGCQSTRRSTTGYFVQLGGAPISWRAKKQRVVSRSSAEAEYRAMASATSEVLWLRFLLRELQVVQRAPTPLYCDNQAALHISANPVFHERTKHVEMDCYFVRERVSSGEILPQKVKTTQQLADIFTKALGTDQFHHLLSKLGIRDLHAPA
ncbi:unnamed protein product [Linum trigynum]|uniref:Integrase catalytic domain-containing protein n=1 Tax=Linum trigynum TaxID=586398 RepID=A0AAV2F143_9ROSI